MKHCRNTIARAMVMAVQVLVGLGTAVAQGPRAQATLFQHVSLFDGKAQSLANGMSVLVEGQKIARIAPDIQAPAGATVIDLQGRVMTPGLIAPGKFTVIEEGGPADILVANGAALEDALSLLTPEATPALIMKGGLIQTNTLSGDDRNTGRIEQRPDTERREPETPLTKADLIADDFKGSWPMFGTDLRMKIGGYFKADMVYDFDGSQDKTQLLMSTIPVAGSPAYGESGYFSMFARETRLNFDVRRVKEGAVPLRMFVEADFWNDENHFRLRHAFVVANNFLIGQTWTTLSALESLPFIIDFGGGDALFGGRTTQIRYTRPVGSNWKLAVGVENLPFMGIENPSNLGGKASLLLPLVAFRSDYRWNKGVVFLGSSVAQLRWDGGGTGPMAKAPQVDAFVGGRVYLGETRNTYVTWNVSGGKGSGENILAFAGSRANAVLQPDGTLKTMPAFALILGIAHKWSPTLSSNFLYAYGWLDAPKARDDFALKDGGLSHVNLVSAPVNHFSGGIEYMWGTQRTSNNAMGSARRVQGMVKFDF